MPEALGSTAANTLGVTVGTSQGGRTERSADGNAMELICAEILRLRLSQLIVNEQYKAGKFKVPIHLAMGHEAIAVAVSWVMSGGDKLLLSHRNIAYNLARAGMLRPLLDEYLLKPTGLAGGRYGSMNLLNPEKGVVYTSSILGNQFPVAVGVAMGNEVMGDASLVTVLGGDGSLEEGSLYEAAVMARSLDLPVVFLLENNEWSMATKIKERRRPIDLRHFARASGLAYELLEGNDVPAYIETLRRSRTSCLERREPAIIEVTLTTLGDWRGPVTPEHPGGKFINYHAGPAPKIDLKEWPVIIESSEDPVFVMLQHMPEGTLRLMAKQQLEALQREIA